MKEGVYYRREDYAGFWRRAMVDVVDFIIMAVMVTVSTAAIAPFFPDWFAEVLMGVAGLVWFGYLVVLKGSRFRTPGYRLGRVWRWWGSMGARRVGESCFCALVLSGLGQSTSSLI